MSEQAGDTVPGRFVSPIGARPGPPWESRRRHVTVCVSFLCEFTVKEI